MPPAKKDEKASEETSKKEAKSDAKKASAFSLDDPGLKAKLPILFLILLFFSFAAFLFEKANFHSVDIVDLPRLQYNVAKLYSLTFLLFIVLFSLVLALSVHFGFGSKLLQSLLVLPAALLPAVVLGLVFPKLLGVFLAFAVVAGAASAFASMQKELTLSAAWNVIGRAMLVLMILAFLIAFMKFGANPSYYSDRLFDSAFELVPDVGKQLSEVVGNANVDEAVLRSFVTQETFKKSINVETVQRGIETVPGITNFNASIRRGWAVAAHAQLTSPAAYEEFIKTAVEAVKEIKVKLAERIQNQTATPDADIKKLAAAQAKSIPQVKAALDQFALIGALTVLSIVSLFSILLKTVGTLFVWLLKKIAFS